MPGSALKAAAQHATDTLMESNPQNLTNILWAFATMGVMPPNTLIDRAVERFMQLLPFYNPQGVANTVWAFAMLGLSPGEEAHCALRMQHSALNP